MNLYKYDEIHLSLKLYLLQLHYVVVIRFVWLMRIHLPQTQNYIKKFQIFNRGHGAWQRSESR